ncbi:AF4/FMR2 family member 1-like isoform X3 [Chiroxiphia lanceolata]|uniref:AF4/FMR2 family member 1-like isoform X3 n=1 Tax=Chiroxiphia lanceolata TaxID=296741 RepID=UPI0013CECE2E|nr:AF4/FMR2 family member 1-like isoform X3 [Chiroxiphia lanceolata]
MEPPEKGKSDESLSKKNRDLLRLEAQEKRRREAPGEKDQFPGKTPIFAKPHKTDNKDALSKRIRKVMGNFNDFKAYMRQNFRKVIWIPKKFKSRSWSRTNCREPSSSQTKTFQSSVMEQPLKNSKTSESPELEPFLEKSNSTDVSSVEDILREMTFSFSRPVSPLHTPPKAEPSELRCSKKQTNSTDVPSIEDILREMTYSFSRPVSPLQTPPKAEPSELPCSTKQTNTTDVPSIEDILREMTYSFSRPVSPLQTPPKAEPAKLPCSTKDTDGSAAQNQEQSGTASGTLPSSQPRTSVLLDDLQLSDSEESDDNQVVERPPSPLAPPRYSVLLDDLQLSDSEESDDNQVVERPPSPLAPPRHSVLLDDLQLSDSEESDDNQVVEKPPSALVSPRDSALQSQPRSVASSPSSSSETSDSESSVDWETVDSESSSDLEMETTWSDGDVGDPPSAPAPEDMDGSAAQNEVCSWMTCSSVIVRRAMTTKLLKSLLLHLVVQDLCSPAAQSQGAPVTLRAPHPRRQLTQRAPRAQRPTTLGVSKGLASPWCTTGPRDAGRRTATLIHWRSEPSLPGTNRGSKKEQSRNLLAGKT